MTKREQLIRAYRAAYIADFGDEPPLLEPGPGYVFEMSDEIFPQFSSFFNSSEIKEMIGFMRQRLHQKAINCDS